MKFTPKKETELSNLLPAGIYDCEVMESEDKISTAGNEMIKVKLSVFNSEGKRHTVFDYLMEKLAYKLRHAAYTFGQGDKYEAGDMDAYDLQGQSGRVKIKIVVDPNGSYPDKNEVVDYIFEGQTKADKEKIATIKRQAGEALLGDDLPF